MPLPGECTIPNIVYQANVSIPSNDTVETYVGISSTAFKARYYNHFASFRHPTKRLQTELSRHIWSLKDRGLDFTISWKILRKAQPYNNITENCQLCLWKKYLILYKPQLSSLNKRNDFLSICRHSSKFLLKNAVT